MTKLKCVKHTYGLTVGKLYDAVVSNQYDFIDDNSMPRYHSKEALVGCFEVVEDDVTTIKREGVVALLPEGSEFKIGQRVKVDRSGYIGYTTIIRYNYCNDEYATECDEDSVFSHDCEGLAKEKWKGLWVAESDIIESVEAKQPKWSEWIENTTGKCPEGLKRKQKIKLKWSDGDEFNITRPHKAAWYFSQGYNHVNITHYKVKLKDIAKDAPANDSKDKQNTDWQDNVLGLCPVPPNKVVEAKLQCGEIIKWEAKDLNWGDTLSADRKIVKWRLV